MGQDEVNNIFAEIIGAQQDMPELEVPEPAEVRKDGLHYLATVDSVATYELVVEGRVVLHVLVNEAAAIEMPAALAGQVHPQATAHAIMIAHPKDHSIVIPTNGVVLMGKHYLKTQMIRTFVYPRAVKFMIRVHNIGL